MDMETNKIFGAVLVAGILAMLGGFFSDIIFPAHHGKGEETKAYVIEVPEGGADTGGVVANAGPEPIADLMADADIERGKKLSKACLTCHSFDQGGANGTGPALWGVAGRKVAGVGGFAYSDAMKEKGGSWTTAELNAFLWKPKKTLPGTKMNYKGFKKPTDRAAIIAWMQTLK